MQYRNDQTGRPISLLGYGCMRFTRKGAGIDLEKAEREVLAAIGAGVNYFDTAYIYPGSEAALGEILDRNHCRDQVRIATKLPQYLVRGKGDFERYFAEELRRLRTDHVDFYLMHMLTDVESWHKLEAAGVREWLDAKRAAGQIGQVGFSFHGNTEMFKKLLEVYPWNFCQIQYNYLDEHSQARSGGRQRAAGYHHGTAARRQAREPAAAGSQAAVCRKPARLDPGRVGAALAVGPAGRDLRAVRHERPRDD